MITPNRTTRRAWRTLGAVPAAALALGLLPVTPASADVADICPAPGQTNAFTDDEGNTHEASIDCGKAYGIINGKTATTFEPRSSLTRGQAASLLVQLAEVASGQDLVADATDEFTDDDGDVHESNIEKAADNGILSGFEDGTFRPLQQISRAQFATIVVQTAELLLDGALPADDTDEFDDDDGNVHESNIEKAVDNDILVGTGPRAFSPQANVTRDQTASILIGTAGNVLFPAGAFAPAQLSDLTEAPELVRATFVETRTNDNGTTTGADPTADDFDETVVRFDFDETVANTTVDAALFHLVTFDNRRFGGVTAQRSGDRLSVLVTFGAPGDPVGAGEFADVSLATVDQDAAVDLDGLGNPIGAVALNAARTFAAGETTAPDLEAVGNLRSAGAGSEQTLVDFTFDEAAFVVVTTAGTPVAGATNATFQLVFADGSDAACAPVPDTATTGDADDFVGDGTEVITVTCANAEFGGNAAADLARGVVLADAVSDRDEAADAGTGVVPFEGSTNPLQAVDVAATIGPDLVSVTFNLAANTATYNFDDTVGATGAAGLGEVGDASGFSVYNVTGEATSGASFAGDEAPADNKVTVTFDSGVLADAVGASVAAGAVNEAGAPTTLNQEDEIGVTGLSVAAGATDAPDLTGVARQTEVDETTNPITGEVTTRTTITFRFTMDEDVAATVDDAAGQFTIVDAAGVRTDLSACTRSTTAGAANVVECVVNDAGGTGAGPIGDVTAGQAGLAAAAAAVLATMDDAAVADSSGNANPEGAKPVRDVAA